MLPNDKSKHKEFRAKISRANSGVKNGMWKDGRSVGPFFCEDCGIEIKNTRAKRCRSCFYKSVKGKKNPNKATQKGSRNYKWNGGRKTNSQGYILILKPDHPNSDNQGYVREHHLTMENAIQRYLSREEVVHHTNGIKDDNRIENLELCENQSIHMRKEHMENIRIQT